MTSFLIIETPGDLLRGHWTIADEMLRFVFLDTADHRPCDLLRNVMRFFLHSIRAVVTGATLDCMNFRFRNLLQLVTGFEANILHAQMTGDLVGHLAERRFEIGF